MRITGPRRTTTKPGKANPITLGILFMLVGGITFFWFGLPPLQYSKSSKTWPSASGEVIKSEIDTWKKDGKTHYSPQIVYSYTVDGKKLTSSKITVGDSPFDSNISPAKRIQAEYPVGKQVIVFYDPDVPSSSALKPGIQKNDLLLAGITGLFLVAGVFLFFDGMKKKLKQWNFGSENNYTR